ncbi:MAG: response regulator, partial [Desulfovibrionales bacterium]
LLTLSDTGTGMDEETQKHIFEPFYTTKPLGSGTGIGLSTVYGIVTAHNGAIHCYSQPQQGSTFKVYLPEFMECTDCGITVEAPAVTQAGSNQIILLVDDEESVLDVAREVLSMNGYTVFTAGSGEEALKTYTAEAVDLTVLDLGMPGIGGEACLRRLIEIDPEARVVLASGYGAHKMAKAPEAFGAAAFLSSRTGSMTF